MGLRSLVHGLAPRRVRWPVLLAALPLTLLAAIAFTNPAQAEPGLTTEIQHGGPNGKCLDVATQNNTTVQLWDCHGVPEQNWNYSTVPGSGSYIQIVNWHTGTCLDALGSVTAGTAVLMQPCTQSASQLWLPSRTSELAMLSNLWSGMCLDLRGNRTSNGTIIQQYTCDQRTSAQLWDKGLGWAPTV